MATTLRVGKPNKDRGTPDRVVYNSFTRPANTTQYTAGDVASDSTSSPTVLEIENCAAESGGQGIIQSASIVDSAYSGTPGDFTLWVFSTAPTADNDNAAFTPTDAELLNLECVIPIANGSSYAGDTTAGAGGNRVYQSGEVNRFFLCASGSRSLHVVMVVDNAYTPISEEQFTVMLKIV